MFAHKLKTIITNFGLAYPEHAGSCNLAVLFINTLITTCLPDEKACLLDKDTGVITLSWRRNNDSLSVLIADGKLSWVASNGAEVLGRDNASYYDPCLHAHITRLPGYSIHKA
jgi:hypothetical protein